MTEQFVPYELTLELKSIGFNEDCLLIIAGGTDLLLGDKKPDFKYEFKPSRQPMYLTDKVPAKINKDYIVRIPLWQQAFDWLREEYNIIGTPYDLGLGWGFDVHKYESESEYKYEIIHSANTFTRTWGSYELAKKNCLKKMIEIVKECKKKLN